MLSLDECKQKIRSIADFPKPGILFRDINPALRDAKTFESLIFHMKREVEVLKPDLLLGIESRGFILGGALARELDIGFAPIRKPGKLPGPLYVETYELEYGRDQLEIQRETVKEGTKVLIVDDVLATGGTAAAAARLCEKAGARILGVLVLIELKALSGRSQLREYPVHRIFSF